MSSSEIFSGSYSESQIQSIESGEKSAATAINNAQWNPASLNQSAMAASALTNVSETCKSLYMSGTQSMNKSSTAPETEATTTESSSQSSEEAAFNALLNDTFLDGSTPDNYIAPTGVATTDLENLNTLLTTIEDGDASISDIVALTEELVGMTVCYDNGDYSDSQDMSTFLADNKTYLAELEEILVDTLVMYDYEENGISSATSFINSFSVLINTLIPSGTEDKMGGGFVMEADLDSADFTSANKDNTTPSLVTYYTTTYGTNQTSADILTDFYSEIDVDGADGDNLIQTLSASVTSLVGASNGDVTPPTPDTGSSGKVYTSASTDPETALNELFVNLEYIQTGELTAGEAYGCLQFFVSLGENYAAGDYSGTSTGAINMQNYLSSANISDLENIESELVNACMSAYYTQCYNYYEDQGLTYGTVDGMSYSNAEEYCNDCCTVLAEQAETQLTTDFGSVSSIDSNPFVAGIYDSLTDWTSSSTAPTSMITSSGQFEWNSDGTVLSAEQPDGTYVAVSDTIQQGCYSMIMDTAYLNLSGQTGGTDYIDDTIDSDTGLRNILVDDGDAGECLWILYEEFAVPQLATYEAILDMLTTLNNETSSESSTFGDEQTTTSTTTDSSTGDSTTTTTVSSGGFDDGTTTTVTSDADGTVTTTITYGTPTSTDETSSEDWVGALVNMNMEVAYNPGLSSMLTDGEFTAFQSILGETASVNTSSSSSTADTSDVTYNGSTMTLEQLYDLSISDPTAQVEVNGTTMSPSAALSEVLQSSQIDINDTDTTISNLNAATTEFNSTSGTVQTEVQATESIMKEILGTTETMEQNFNTQISAFAGNQKTS